MASIEVPASLRQDHQPVPAYVEGTRAQLGGVVERAGGGVHDVEHAGVREVQLLGAAADHRLLEAVLHRLVTVADGLAGADAGGAGGDDAPGDAVVQGQVRRAGVAHELEVRGGRHALQAVVAEERATELLQLGAGAVSRSISEADVARGEVLRREPGVRHGLVGGVGREQRDAAHGAGLPPRVGGEVEVADGRRQARGQVAVRVPVGLGGNSVAPFAQRQGDRIERVADGARHADAGDHHAAEAHNSPPLTTITWPVMYEACSLARNATASATSRGCPRRRMGMSGMI